MDVLSISIALLFLVIVGAFILAPLVTIQSFWQSWLAHRGFRTFCAQMPGGLRGDGGRCSFDLEGRTITAHLTTSTQNLRHGVLDPRDRQLDSQPRVKHWSGPILELSIAADLPVAFALSREGIFDTVAKGVGLVSEHQTGDQAFDAKVYITCDDSTFIKSYLTPERRKAIMSLFDAGIQQITRSQTAGSLLLFTEGRFLRRSRSMQESRQIVSALIQLLPGEQPVPTADLTEVVPQPPSTRLEKLVALPVVVAFLYGYRAEVFSDAPVFTHVVVGTIALVALYGALLIVRFRTSSGFHRMFLTRICLATILLLGCGHSLLLGLNKMFDFSAERDEQATLVSLTSRRGIGRIPVTTHYLANFATKSALGMNRTGAVPVSEESHARLQGKIGQPSRISIRRGVLGYEWIAGYSDL